MNLLNWGKKETKKELDNYSDAGPIISVQDEFAKTINAFNKMLQMPSFSSKTFEELTIHPSIDIVEDEAYFKVEAELPGVGEENIRVSITDGMLIIRGEKSTSDKDRNKNYLNREIGYGSYMRSIPLPRSLDVDKAKASFKKGMLWITIPKKTKGITNGARDLKIERL